MISNLVCLLRIKYSIIQLLDFQNSSKKSIKKNNVNKDLTLKCNQNYGFQWFKQRFAPLRKYEVCYFIIREVNSARSHSKKFLIIWGLSLKFLII